MASSELCPHCGYNLEADVIIERDGFTIDPRGHVYYEGILIPGFEPKMVSVLHSIAKANGRKLDASVIADRAGSEVAGSSVRVNVFRIRKALKQCDVPSPIQTTSGHTSDGRCGYWWAV